MSVKENVLAQLQGVIDEDDFYTLYEEFHAETEHGDVIYYNDEDFWDEAADITTYEALQKLDGGEISLERKFIDDDFNCFDDPRETLPNYIIEEMAKWYTANRTSDALQILTYETPLECIVEHLKNVLERLKEGVNLFTDLKIGDGIDILKPLPNEIATIAEELEELIALKEEED